MAYPQQPDWLQELIQVVGQLCPSPESQGSDAESPGKAPADPTAKATRVGRVSADDEPEAGWFWIGLNGRSLEDDQVEAAFLAPHEGARKHKFQVIESLQDGNVLRVRVAEHAPRKGLFLWVPRRAPDLLYTSLRDGLASMEQFDLASRIAEGRADPIPDVTALTGPRPDLNAAQLRAWHATCSPGVHLVWGPPGTGKTRVIAQSLQHLMAKGKTVLLVSGTNIAVDNALTRAVSAINPEPGRMIRAGNPHLAEIADNPAVCLNALVRDRQESLERKRGELQEQIAALRHAPAIGQLVATREALEGFDAAAYESARDRIADVGLLAARLGDLATATGQAGEIARAEADAAGRLRAAGQEHAAAEGARQHFGAAARHQQALDALARELAMAESHLAGYAAERDRLEAERARLRFGQRGAVKASIRENREFLARATERRDQAAELLRQQSPYLQREIAGHLAATAPYTAPALAALDQRLADAQRAAAESAAARGARDRRLRELTTEVSQLRQRPGPTAGDRDLVARADADGLPGKLAGLAELERQARKVIREIAKLEDEHEDVVTRMRKEGMQARRDICGRAAVVAATLALLRMRPELRDRDYDYVIVDEASFASAPEVIFAASRASQGVTLLGDFLQNGPIEPEEFRGSREPAVQRWYSRDCYAFFGVRNAATAQANPGCAVLTEQHRFGPVITELANAVAYGGVLQAAGQTAPRPPDQPEVVIVDVDGLGEELAGIRLGQPSGKWWPVGALVAHALAVQRVSQAEEAGEPVANLVGIVTPYKPQHELVRDMLAESGASAQIEAGTSHRFQGREFDTVIFDLVEDGKGWVASGDLEGSGYAAGGLRMFNVGITRAQRRLYLIANEAVIRKADKGPLRAVGHLVRAGKVHVVRAATVLGLPVAPADDPVGSELWHALRGHATLINLFDEENLPEELCQRIDAAASQVWLWSPWVGNRSEQLLPHLLAAQDRGVRVHPVVLPAPEVNRHLRGRHEDLAAQIARTVYLGREHQKIILIDDNLAFLGSMNVLAHRPGSRLEVMALFQSRTLVQSLLTHERTDQLSQPPTCPRCGAQVRLARLFTKAGKLHWHCRAKVDEVPCDWRQAFPDRPGGRNQAARP